MTTDEWRKRCILISFLSLFTVLSIGAVPVRGIVVKNIKLEIKQDQILSLEFMADEIAVLSLLGESRFLEAIQVELVLSEALKRYSDSFALEIYSEIKPSPKMGIGDYTGKKVFSSVLPFSNRIYMKVPMVGAEEDTSSIPGESLGSAESLHPSQFPIFIVVHSISKGLPSSALTRNFFLSFKPEVANEGLLELGIVLPEGFEEASFTLLLDENAVELENMPVLLTAGTHTLRVVSEVFKAETASFAVNPGQVTKLDIPLESDISYVTIESLEGAVVYLDGEKIILVLSRKKQLTEGEHTIRFKLDRYSVTKKFSVERGKNYTISLELDIQVREESE